MSKFHFIKNQKVTLCVLALVIVIGLVSFFVRGFNIDIDFSGGTEMKIDLGTEVTKDVCDDINDIIRNHEKLGNDYVSSTTQSTDSNNMAIIRTGTAALTNEQTIALQDALIAKYPTANANNIQINTIAPTIGSQLTKTAIIAVAVAIVLCSFTSGSVSRLNRVSRLSAVSLTTFSLCLRHIRSFRSPLTR
jgi:preprotein translocase subunit SecF